MKKSLMIHTFLITLFLYGCEADEKSATPLEKILGVNGGISMEDYQDFQQLAPPKLLFSCDVDKVRDPALECFVKNVAKVRSGEISCGISGENLIEYVDHVYVGYIAQLGALLTYNQMLQDAKDECESLNARFELLEGVFN